VSAVAPSAPSRAIATIDVGTNTTLLLVARPRPGAPLAEPEILADDAEVTRLGRGIGTDGRLGPEGIARTLSVLENYVRIAASHQARIAAIGTEALRRAPNADDFMKPAERLGVPVEVISGEANLTFRAVAESFPSAVADGRVAIVDIGGGSTEIIVCDRGVTQFRRSLPLGSVRLHECHVRTDPPSAVETRAIEADVRAGLDSVADAFAGPPLALLIGVAGTVTSLAAMSLGLRSYDSGRVHGAELSVAQLDAQIHRLAGMTQREREGIAGLDPRRADVIFAGAVLLRTIAERAGVSSIRVSDRGIRWGLFYERASAP
jgi:exopolyphosphatase / guanosine-5'-triphosphate,3'-diphosphate pyrophosphatase